MPVYNSKCEPFTFDSIVDQFSSVIEKFPDKRTGNNTRYTIEDATLGPSFRIKKINSLITAC